MCGNVKECPELSYYEACEMERGDFIKYVKGKNLSGISNGWLIDIFLGSCISITKQWLRNMKNIDIVRQVYLKVYASIQDYIRKNKSANGPAIT